MKFKLLLAFLWLLVMCHGSAFAVPLWNNAAEQGDDYLLGTIHIGDERLNQLPQSIKDAIDKVELVIVETDMSLITPLQQQKIMQTKALLPDGQTLQDVLSQPVFKRVRDHLATQGMPIEPLSRFQPWFVALTLVQMSYAQQGFDAKLGVDVQVIEYAKQNGKKVIGLESFELQMSFFEQIFQQHPEVKADDVLMDTLDELDQFSELPKQMMSAWFAADMDKFNGIYAQTLTRSEFDRAAEAILLSGRNLQWRAQIDPLLTSHSVLVAVGTLHFSGPNNLKTLLKSKFSK